MSRRKIYRPSDRIEFGFYRSELLHDIYYYNPSYLCWLIGNVEDFCINMDEFEAINPIQPMARLDGFEFPKESWDRMDKKEQFHWKIVVFADKPTLIKVREYLSKGYNIPFQIYKFTDGDRLMNMEKCKRLMR